MIESSEKTALERKYIVVKLGNEHFGISIGHVRSIERTFDVTPIPNSADFIDGITHLRGSVLPVVDLRKLLSIQTEASSSGDLRLLAASIKGTEIGLLVDSANEVIDIDPLTFQSTPEILKGDHASFIQGVAKLEDRLLILLDVNHLLSDVTLLQLEQLQQ